jgi:hypothetical protein
VKIKIILLVCLLIALTGCQKEETNVQQSGRQDKQQNTNGRQNIAPETGLANAGFETGELSKSGRVEGWHFEQHAGPASYEFTLDKEIFHGGSRSLKITNIGAEPYGVAQQKIPVHGLRGKEAILSAWIRTENADGTGAGLTIRMLNSGAILAYNFMSEALVEGTQDWKQYSISLQVPERATDIEVGIMLQGKGMVWADDFELTFK